MMKNILFREETSFHGRNGTGRCSGIVATKHFKGVWLAPLTSRRVTGNCGIEIPEEEIPKVAETLMGACQADNAPKRRVFVAVKASELVTGKYARQFWADFTSSADFSWGDNNHTLIDKDTMARAIDEHVGGAGNVPEAVVDRIAKKFRELPSGTYVDLED